MQLECLGGEAVRGSQLCRPILPGLINWGHDETGCITGFCLDVVLGLEGSLS